MGDQKVGGCDRRSWVPRGPLVGVMAAVAMAGLSSIGCSLEPEVTEEAVRPNIVLVVADTLRADHFGSSSGVHHRSRPVFDKLRSEGAYFASAYAPTSWTLPSVVSIFLSQYPSQHGSTSWVSHLGKAGTSFVEELKHAGYRTAGWSSNRLISEGHGFDRGFDEFEMVSHRDWRFGTPPSHEASSAPAGDLLSKAVAWLDHGAVSAGDAPFFLYLHWMEAHTPYSCPPSGGESCEKTIAVLNRRLISQFWDFNSEEMSLIRGFYDADVDRVASALEQLTGALEDRGLLDDTWLIVTADHGEMLGEHERYVHGQALHEGTLRVPLLIRPPKPEAALEAGVPVSLIDIAPTILDLAGIDSPNSFEGQSLRPALDGDSVQPRPMVAELLPVREDMGPRYLHVLALIDGSTKYLLGVDGQVQRFDLSKDPGEQNPLPATLDDLRPGLAEAGVSFQHLDALEGPNLKLSPETAEALRALGYLQE